MSAGVAAAPAVRGKAVRGSKRSASNRVARIAGRVVLYLVLTAGGLVMLLPLAWMLSTASKPLDEAIAPVFIPFPSKFMLFENIVSAFGRVPMATFFKNSAIVSSCAVVGDILLASLAGYSFAKFKYPGRDLLFTLVLATMMIPGFVVIIPLYIVVYRFGWLNSYQGLIVPGLVGAFSIFLMRQWMLTIPSELLDAARIDGASEPYIYARIVMPMSLPAIATLGIFTFGGSWDSYIWPLLIVSEQSMFTLPIGLTFFKSQSFGQWQTLWNELMAVAFVAQIPTFTVYFLFQRQFIRGMHLTGLKG
jgi:multiple sugar transport system permease protein